MSPLSPTPTYARMVERTPPATLLARQMPDGAQLEPLLSHEAAATGGSPAWWRSVASDDQRQRRRAPDHALPRCCIEAEAVALLLIEAPATEDAEWVARDEHGAVVVVEDDPAREEVELQRDSCSGGLEHRQ